MALINCSECKKEISDSAKSCPNCGYKITKKSNGCLVFILIGLVLLIAFYIIGSNSNSEGLIEDESTYSKSWRSPQGNEYRDIGRIMVKNNITGCGEYHVKETTQDEFVVACTSDGKNWVYYVVYPNLDKIYLASVEMEEKLKPPY